MFLRDILEENVELKILEKLDRLGGRTWSINLPDGSHFDIGATSIVEENRYAMEFKDKFNLIFAPKQTDVSLVIWDNKDKKIKFEEQKGILSIFFNLFSMLYNYQIYGLFQTKSAINEEVWKIMKIYKQQDELVTWNSPYEMFESVGMDVLLKETLYDYFIKTNKMHPGFANDFVVPICLNNYLQNSSISAMGGLISSVALVSKFHKFEKGADGFAMNLAKNSTADISLKTTVTTISKIENGIKVESKSCDSCPTTTEVFDKLVLASSIEQSNIKFIGFDFKVSHKLQFRKTHVTILKGLLKEELFGLDSSKYPHEIFYNENENPDFISIAILKRGDNTHIYKIFSSSERSDEFLDKHFLKVEWKFRHWFNAYPMLKPISKEKIHPFKLDDNLYYVNAMESIISTMETEMLSSRNIALLLAKDYYDH